MFIRSDDNADSFFPDITILNAGGRNTCRFAFSTIEFLGSFPSGSLGEGSQKSATAISLDVKGGQIVILYGLPSSCTSCFIWLVSPKQRINIFG